MTVQGPENLKMDSSTDIRKVLLRTEALQANIEHYRRMYHERHVVRSVYHNLLRI